MYVKKINRLHSTTVLWEESPSIVKLWITILMYIDERGYICATSDELMKYSKLTDIMFENAFDFLTGKSDQNKTEYIIHTEKGLRVNCFDRIDRNRIDLFPKWKEKSKEGFAEYIELTRIAYDEIMKDYVFLLELKNFFPHANIAQSIQKAFSVYWGTERAWLKRRRKRANDFNWKLTIAKTLQFNLVRTTGTDYEHDFLERMVEKQSKETARVTD